MENKITDYERVMDYLRKNPQTDYRVTLDAGGTVVEILTPGYPCAILCFDNGGTFTTIFAVE